MPKLTQVVAQLRRERSRVQRELDCLDEAISVLGRMSGRNATRAVLRRPRRKFSAAARRRMAAAQKARWAKLREQRQKKAASR